jgi:nonsense-mediated mRNA decay protein 3
MCVSASVLTPVQFVVVYIHTLRTALVTLLQTHKDGMDFFYGERNQAARMMSFLESVIPVRIKQSKKLISADNHSNTYNFHYSYIVMVVPVCKDDLVLLPAKLSENMGQFTRLCLAQRVSNSISLVDPLTAQTAEVNIEKYSKYEFDALLSSTRLIPFVVLGTEPLPMPNAPTAPHGKRLRRARLAEVTVARESDLGQNDVQMTG